MHDATCSIGTELAALRASGARAVGSDIDPVTYAFMGYKDVAVADHTTVGNDGTRYVKKGHVMGWGAVLGIAIVQKPGQLP